MKYRAQLGMTIEAAVDQQLSTSYCSLEVPLLSSQNASYVLVKWLYSKCVLRIMVFLRRCSTTGKEIDLQVI
jgi:hypothetical protein